jgi:mRNA interferase RelE/StbE
LAWQIEIKKTAEKQIHSLNKIAQVRIVKAMREIINHPDPRHHGKALKGDKEKLWRYRVGDYRLICKINDKEKTIYVLEVGHRKEIYR